MELMYSTHMISLYKYVSSTNIIIGTKSSSNTYNRIMANLDQNSVKKSNSTSILSQARRKMSFRRKKLPVEGGRKKQRRKFSPMKIFRLDGLKGHKLGMNKIKEFYWSAVNDILERKGEDSFQRQLATETSFAIPMMGFSFALLSPNPRAI